MTAPGDTKTDASVNLQTQIEELPQFQRLKRVMTIYMTDQLENLNDVNITNILDDFLYLLSNFDFDLAFELIENALEIKCNFESCNVFKRNHRNRSEEKAQNEDTVITQILDKIHCHYLHTYDIGYRLNAKDRQLLNNHRSDRTPDSNNKYIVNNEIPLMNKIISHKSSLKMTDNDNENIFYSLKYQTYHPGIKFCYDNECNPHSRKVYSLYPSLKEELLNNELCTINIYQFNSEYQKAVIHRNTVHC
eukprot:362403_1